MITSLNFEALNNNNKYYINVMNILDGLQDLQW